MKDKIKVGLIGLGRVGMQMHLYELERFADMFELAACCDVLKDRVDDVLKRYPAAHGYTEAEALIADPDVELVTIAVPSRLHVMMAEKALAAGKIVFLEKPFALSMEGLARLRKLDEQYPGKLFLRHNRRFEACYNHILDIMKSGVLGDVYEIKLRRLRHRFRDDWQTRLDCGGGQLYNWGPHLIDQALQFLEGDVESVFSDMKVIAARGDAEDHIKLVFRGVNGRVVDVEISDAVPILNEPVATVYGTRGVLISQDEQTLDLQYLAPDFPIPPAVSRPEAPPIWGDGVYSTAPEPVWVRESIPVAPANGYDLHAIYKYLFLAIRENTPFPVRNSEGFRNTEMMLKIKAAHPAFTGAGDL